VTGGLTFMIPNNHLEPRLLGSILGDGDRSIIKGEFREDFVIAEIDFLLGSGRHVSDSVGWKLGS
jgi:hypothetical protein